MRAFLKWPGGKYRLLDTLHSHFPVGKKLVEPFVGAGSVFLNTDYARYLVNDVNLDLIDLYQRLQKNGIDFVESCRRYFKTSYNQEETYYRFRARFNRLETGDEKAALFLYLNRHGYNGLCRYNQQGYFNVPFGRYKKPYFPDKELAHFLKRAKKVQFINMDFERVFQRVRANDVVYCDPPYVPLTDSAYFTDYQPNRFTLDDHARLVECAQAASRKGACVLISNHDNAITRSLYQHAEIVAFEVSRFISCKANDRQPVKELLACY